MVKPPRIISFEEFLKQKNRLRSMGRKKAPAHWLRVKRKRFNRVQRATEKGIGSDGSDQGTA